MTYSIFDSTLDAFGIFLFALVFFHFIRLAIVAVAQVIRERKSRWAIKRLRLPLVCLAVLLCLSARGQTNPPSVISGPAEQIINFLGTGTNWSIAAYGIAGKNPGAGIGAFVQMSAFMEAGLRLDGVIKDKKLELWMPSGNFQLQAPIKLFGKLTTVPFVVGGIATPVIGSGKRLRQFQAVPYPRHVEPGLVQILSANLKETVQNKDTDTNGHEDITDTGKQEPAKPEATSGQSHRGRASLS